MEWVTGAGNARAIAFYEGIGATVKHTIRVCRLDADGIARINEKPPA